MRLVGESPFDLLPAFRGGCGMIILGSGLAAPRPSGAHFVPFDGAAATRRIVQVTERLEGGLFADPPTGRLDELEDSYRPALVPAPQCEAERCCRLSLAVAGVDDQHRSLPPLSRGQSVLRNQLRHTGWHQAARLWRTACTS